MKLERWCVAAALILMAIYSAGGNVPAQNAVSTAAVSPLTITLSTTTNRYKIDAPIPVAVILTNVSNAPVHLRLLGVSEGSYRGLGWRFSLTINGERAPKTAFHRAISGEYRPGDPAIDVDPDFINYVLKPGVSDRTTIDLRKLFNITQPGSYLFSVEMPRNGESQTAIESQPLRLNIYP